MAADGISYAGRETVLWRDILPTPRWIRASELSARVAQYCQRLRGKAWRRGRAGEDGGERDCAVGVVRRKRRARFSRRDCRDSDFGVSHVRSAAWRLWAGAEISPSL